MTDSMIDTASSLGLRTTQRDQRSVLDFALDSIEMQNLHSAAADLADLQHDLDVTRLFWARTARRAGWNWEQIGFSLGVTRQAAHKRYAHRCD